VSRALHRSPPAPVTEADAGHGARAARSRWASGDVRGRARDGHRGDRAGVLRWDGRAGHGHLRAADRQRPAGCPDAVPAVRGRRAGRVGGAAAIEWTFVGTLLLGMGVAIVTARVGAVAPAPRRTVVMSALFLGLVLGASVLAARELRRPGAGARGARPRGGRGDLRDPRGQPGDRRRPTAGRLRRRRGRRDLRLDPPRACPGRSCCCCSGCTCRSSTRSRGATSSSSGSSRRVRWSGSRRSPRCSTGCCGAPTTWSWPCSSG
jgi:hypothetical protein